MDFELISDYKPTGDQPEAIRQLVEGLGQGIEHQTLLGVKILIRNTLRRSNI